MCKVAAQVHSFFLEPVKKIRKFYTLYGEIMEVLYILLQLQKLSVLRGSKKHGFKTDLFTPTAIILTHCLNFLQM